MNRAFFRSALIGAGVAAGSFILFAVVGALAASAASDPDKLIAPIAYATLALSSVVGGAVASRAGECGPGASAVCGAILAILHLIVRLIFGGSLSFFPVILIYAAMILLSAASGILFRRRASRSQAKTARKFKKLSKRARG